MSHPIVGIGIFVKQLHNNEFVFMQRRGSHGAGQLALPGGKLEFMESVEGCSRREVKEELGVNITNYKPIPYFSEDKFYTPIRQFITLYTYGETNEEVKIMEPDKCSRLIFLNKVSECRDYIMFCHTEDAWRALDGMR